jgi:branched-chain amino acid transport system substrate-binding protein
LTIGTIVPMSGPIAPTGIPEADGVKLAAAQINAAGGIKVGGKTYKIKIQGYDDGNVATQGLAAMTKMVEQDNVHFLVGLATSTVAVPAEPFMRQNASNLAVVVIGAADSSLPKLPNVFLMQATTTDGFDPANVALQKKLGWKRVAVVTDTTDPTSMAAMPALLALYKKLGIKVVAQESVTSTQSDFSSLITRMKPLNVDGVYLRLFAPEQNVIVKQARELGWNVPFTDQEAPPPNVVGTILTAKQMTNVYDVVGPTLQDVAASPDPATAQKAQALEAAYQKMFGAPPGSYTLNGYEGLEAMAHAIIQAGSLNPTAVEAQLANLKPYGLVMPITPASNGSVFGQHAVNMIFYVSKWVDGKTQAPFAIHPATAP